HEEQGEAAAALPYDMVRCYLNGAVDQMQSHGREALCAFAEGDELRLMQMGLKRFLKPIIFNSKEARRRIAQNLIEKNQYSFS
ncbi:MAG: acyl-CoA dehydrogenase, partial [Ferruginibacter sp.]